MASAAPERDSSLADAGDAVVRPLTHRDLDALEECLARGAVGPLLTCAPRLIAQARLSAHGALLAEIHIPGFQPRGSLNSRGHWTIQHRRVKREHALVGLALAAGAPKLRNKGALVGQVVITQNAVRLVDSDNAVARHKGTRDAVAKFLGIDDGDPRITWVVEQKKVPRAGVGTVVRVEGRRE